MHIENISYDKMSLDRNGQSMLIQVYEKEIYRLNNIIDGLEKWVKDYIEKYDVPDTDFICAYLRDILDKLKELKENNNE